MSSFDGKDVWIFDLDNTLYPAECNLFAQVADKMNEFIVCFLGIDVDAAKELRRDYYLRYGTTMAGLMENNNLQPDEFLEFVHDIDHAVLEKNTALADGISQLPGKRYIYTNGSRKHAEGVAGKVGVLHLFDDIFDIKDSNYIPKPHGDAFDLFLKRHDVDPLSAAMFEDLPHNLETAHELGMTTVLVHSVYDDHPSQGEINDGADLPPHIHHRTDNLAEFLTTIV